MNSFRNNAGVTLLELMFASGVLALALSLLFGALLSFNVVGQLGESRTVAASHLASVLEEMRTLTLEEVMFYQPPAITSPGTDQAVSVTYFDASDTQVELPLASGAEVPDDLPNPLQVRAELIWTDHDGRFYSMSAVTQHGR